MRCVDCGEAVYFEDGVGLVEVRSGDDGGMYDYCMASDDDKHHTDPQRAQREARITSYDPGDDVAWEFEIEDRAEAGAERYLKSKGLW